MEVINEPLSDDEVQRFEQEYQESINNRSDQVDQAKLNLAWALIRSKDKNKTLRGIQLFEELSCSDPKDESRRAYLLYLAAAYFKIKDYDYAMKIIDKLLEQEPKNQQAIRLKEEMAKRVKRQAITGAAVVTGAITAIGLGLLMLKKR